MTALDGEITGGPYRRPANLTVGTVFSRDVAQRPTVEVRGAANGITVGPDQVLVLTFPAHVGRGELEQIRGRLLDSELRPGQILLVAGDIRMAVVPAGTVNTREAKVGFFDVQTAGPDEQLQLLPSGVHQRGKWQTAVCSAPKCAATIIWAVTENGRRPIPVDVMPDDQRGNIELDQRDQAPGAAPTAVILSNSEKARRRMLRLPLYTSHFATCPEADHFRRKGHVP